MAHSIIGKYINFNTYDGRVNLILCLLSLVSINFSDYVILLQELIRAIKAGKIKKITARLIVRKLKKRKIPISPKLLDAVRN